jgi:streptogramin lyase
MLRQSLISVILIALGGSLTMPATAGRFEDLGVPVTKAMVMSKMIGPDEQGQNTKVYLGFNQNGAPTFVVQADPVTGVCKQFNAPSGGGPWALCTGPDKKVYIGSCEGAAPEGAMYVFDPAKPNEGIRLVGRPSETETYLWQFTVGKDGCIYGCTYPQAKIVSFDPATGKLTDHGRMDEQEKYSRAIATGADGWIYTGIGMVKANIVAFDPKTGEHHGLVPDDQRPAGCGDVWNASDGNAYGTLGGKHYRLVGGQGVEISEGEMLPKFTGALPDGRVVSAADLDGHYSLTDPKTGKVDNLTFTYRGAGSMVFAVGEGPHGLIIGGSAVPLQVFSYDPVAGKLDNPGNPTATDGEIYSILPWMQYVFVCAYGGAYLSRWNPDAPWKFGGTPADNPYGICYVGDGHLRPRAMVAGPDGKILIGSQPPYGQWGGAMAVFDPETNKVVENYRHLVPDQGINALAYDPESKLVWGGSSVYGGGGTEPKAKACVIFAWDPVKKEKVLELAPVEGDLQAQAVCVADGKAFFTSVPSRMLTVVDTASRKIVHQAKTEVGYPLEISLQAWQDGVIYGLTDQGIITVDPASYEVKLFAKPPAPPSAGWAMTDTGIYFGAGVHLWRYQW